MHADFAKGLPRLAGKELLALLAMAMASALSPLAGRAFAPHRLAILMEQKVIGECMGSSLYVRDQHTPPLPRRCLLWLLRVLAVVVVASWPIRSVTSTVPLLPLGGGQSHFLRRYHHLSRVGPTRLVRPLLTDHLGESWLTLSPR